MPPHYRRVTQRKPKRRVHWHLYLYGMALIPSGTVAVLFATTNSAGGNNAGYLLDINSSNQLQLSAVGGSNITSAALTLSANVPYLAIASSNASVTNLALMRLDNGVIKTSVGAGLTLGAGTYNGTYSIGGWQNTNNFESNCSIATSMFSYAYVSMAQILAWLAAPWDFWYPPTVGQLMLGAGRKPAQNYNQSASWSTASALSDVRQIGKIAPVSTVSAVTPVKQVGKIAPVSTVSALSAAKAVGKAAAISTVSALSALASKVRLAAVARSRLHQCGRSGSSKL